MSSWRDWVAFVRTVDRLLTLEQKHGDAITKLQQEVERLRDRIAALESHEGILVVEAKGAAATAASAVAVTSMGDLSRRVGVLEGRLSGQNSASQDRITKPRKRIPKSPPARLD